MGARWGGKIDDLSKNPGYFVPDEKGYKFGTTATSLCLLAGLITIQEQQKGEINHALHIALVEALAWPYWSAPAQRTDGHIKPEKNPYAIPEGAIFRLPADLDLDKVDMDPYARMIARAVQKYGVIVRDKSGCVNFYAENPAGRYAEDPYNKVGGILRVPDGKPTWATAPHNKGGRLRGFPFDKLQMLKLQMNKPIPTTQPGQ